MLGGVVAVEAVPTETAEAGRLSDSAPLATTAAAEDPLSPWSG